jgi:hypothetical protein
VTNELFEVASSPNIVTLADQLSPADEAELGRIVTLLRLNPWPDGVLKFSLHLDEVEVIVYNDGAWNVIYRIVSRTLQLLDAWQAAHRPDA